MSSYVSKPAINSLSISFTVLPSPIPFFPRLFVTEQVPYWDNILNAKANLSHITASVKGHEYQPCTEEITRGR